MSFQSADISQLTVADIESLIADGVPESSALEFKRELRLDGDEQKREFLADVSAFANTNGGRLLVGIDAPKGFAAQMPGVDSRETDSQILQMGNLVRDCLRPALVGFQIAAVPCADGRSVIVIDFPVSFVGPHMVTFRGSQRFFARSSNGKHPMEYSEIRSSFLQRGSSAEKLEQLRRDRINRVITGMDFRGIGTTKTAFLLEVVPLKSLHDEVTVDFRGHPNLRADFTAINAYSADATYDFEGFVAFVWNHPDNQVLAYSRLSRYGYVSAYCSSLSRLLDGKQTIASRNFEPQLAQAVANYSSLLRQLGITLPHAVLITLLNGKGVELFRGPLVSHPMSYHPVNEVNLSAPVGIISQENVNALLLLRPQFDAFWNAFGYSSCINYDDAGKWIVERT